MIENSNEAQRRLKFREAVSRVEALIASQERGSVVPHDDIALAAGFGRQSEQWGYLIACVKRRLLAAGVELVSVHDTGYCLSTIDRQLTVGVAEKMRRAQGYCSRARRAVLALPAEELDVRQQQLRNSVAQTSSRIAAALEEEGRLAEARKKSAQEKFGHNP